MILLNSRKRDYFSLISSCKKVEFDSTRVYKTSLSKASIQCSMMYYIYTLLVWIINNYLKATFLTVNTAISLKFNHPTLFPDPEHVWKVETCDIHMLLLGRASASRTDAQNTEPGNKPILLWIL